MGLIRWNCSYGHYEMETDRLTYIVIQQRRRGELMWFALMHDNEAPPREVPGPLPLNRRQAMALCEAHYEEGNDGEWTASGLESQ